MKKRTLILALEHAYHGDTFKAMEVGDDEDYHFAFDKKRASSISRPRSPRSKRPLPSITTS